MNRIFVFYHPEYYPRKKKYEIIHKFDSYDEYRSNFLDYYNIGMNSNIYDSGGITGIKIKMINCDPISEGEDYTAIQIVYYDSFLSDDYINKSSEIPNIVSWITSYLRDNVIDEILS